MQGIVDTRIPENIVLVKGGYDILRYVNGRVRFGWDICRNGYSVVVSGRWDVPQIRRINAANRFNTFSRVYRTVIPSRVEFVRGCLVRLINRYDGTRERLSGQRFNRFDLSASFRDGVKGLHDRIRFPTGNGFWSNRFDLVAMRRNLRRNRYDAVTDFPYSLISGRFSCSRGNIRLPYPCRFGSLRYRTKDRLSGRHSWLVPIPVRLHCRLESVFSRAEIPGLTLFGIPGCYHILMYSAAHLCCRFDSHDGLPPLVRRFYQYDSIVPKYGSQRFHWQAFVRPGWRILASNIVTGESIDLGFIDADSENPALENVSLPDGDYEIAVLTSSLFWKDCREGTVWTITTGTAGERTPLPVIYNLRSSVQNGVTTIRWSANRSELDDCIFAIWFSSETPVDTNRPPDQTIWYFPAQTEYAATLLQEAPTHAAIAAIRTGNDPETGERHEIHLDWSNVPPQRPEDVTILASPLPATDEIIKKRYENDPHLTLWNG